MKRYQYISLFFTAVFFIIVACGGGGGGGGGGGFVGGGGIGGTGSLSAGQITAKGSITVNGVKYETAGSRIFLDDTEVGDDSFLKVGMIVEVEGQINGDRVTGTANTVKFSDSVEGPITSIDPVARELDVLGQLVLVDDFTVFDNGSIIPTNINGLAPNDVVEVSGQFDDLGNIRATHIEKKAPGSEFEVTGFVSGRSGSTFSLNGLTIDFATALLDNFGGGEPQDGDFVEAKGTNFNSVTVTLTATKVENKARAFDDNIEAEVEGFVDSLTTTGFRVVTTSGSVEVRTGTGTVFIGGIASDLVVGTKAEAEGVISGGILQADKVKFKDSVEFEANAATVDAGAGTLTLEGLPGITVRADNLTRFDGVADLNGINAGDNLKIRGRRLSVASTTVVASRIELKSSSPDSRSIIQGPVDSFVSFTSVTIIGVDVNTNFIQDDDFKDNDTIIGEASFFGQLQVGDLVKARLDLTSGNWDQIEFED